jgi:hypothetical protein
MDFFQRTDYNRAINKKEVRGDEAHRERENRGKNPLAV